MHSWTQRHMQRDVDERDTALVRIVMKTLLMAPAAIVILIGEFAALGPCLVSTVLEGGPFMVTSDINQIPVSLTCERPRDCQDVHECCAQAKEQILLRVDVTKSVQEMSRIDALDLWEFIMNHKRGLDIITNYCEEIFHRNADDVETVASPDAETVVQWNVSNDYEQVAAASRELISRLRDAIIAEAAIAAWQLSSR